MAGHIDVRIDEREGGSIEHLTVAHDAKLNTLNRALMKDLTEAAEKVSVRSDLRAVVLTGEGSRAFIGGADITAMAEIREMVGATHFIEQVSATCRVFRDLPVPVIARINGFALGAGLEVAASCDIRVAASTAKFGMPEVVVGIPSVVEAALLPGLIGWGRTRQLLMFGETIGAEEALAWGLVEKVVAPDQLDAAVETLVGQLMHTGQHAVRIQKKLMREWEELPMAEAIAAGVKAFASAWRTDEPRVMMRSFLDKQAARKRGG